MKKLQQKGFTLVELAIVLTIIGLLIGGILKGQQLIANARVTSQMAQIQGISAAVTTFSDTYSGLPGDLSTAATRLPTNGCGGVACVNGNGDGVVGAATAAPVLSAAYGGAPNGENTGFWLDLSAANLISGISGSAVAAGAAITGLPAGKVGGYLAANTITASAGAPAAGTVFWLGGLYVTAGTTNTTAALTSPGPGAGLNLMSPNQAAQIDRKMDDGVNDTGSVVAQGVAASCTAAVTAANPGGYLESTATKNCTLAWKLQ